jgi:CHASE3 domain sensor protein
MTDEERKRRIIEAGRKAIDELIKVAEEPIITDTDNDITADKMKNAAQAKKTAIMDAFEIYTKIQAEEANLITPPNEKTGGFAERRSTK